jgi:uncharacterized protein YbdZ (MbtH family)
MTYIDNSRWNVALGDEGPSSIRTVGQNSPCPSRGPVKDGRTDDCLAYLEEVRTDMSPATLGARMALSEVTT